MFRRALSGPLRAALADTPVVFLHGARQTGKTTLARALIEEGHQARYLTLDEALVLEAASSDPEGFVARLETPVVLDEVQRAPELFRAIKLSVDRDRRPGRFLLTGSAHLLVLPQLADSLVGRMEILTLRPLSQGEIEERSEQAVDALFADTLPREGPASGGDGGEDLTELCKRLARGGYPEAVQRETPERRRAWAEAYLTTVTQRDVRDLANVENLHAITLLLRLLAARSATLSNLAELSRTSGLPRTTLKRYLALLEGTFLVGRLPAWSANLSKRLVRSPKSLLLDTGLLCHLLGLGADRLAEDPVRLGPVLETFVVQELRKQASWSRARPRLFHFRSHAGQEIDIVLEDASGRLVGVEVKARSSVGARDFRSLRAFAEMTGERFHRGVVLYAGRVSLPFGERLDALPISWLWRSMGTS